MAFENRYFPHLLPVDIPVWKRFLAKYGHRYTSIDYDVRVGQGTLPPLSLPANIRQMWSDLSQKRIDAVAHAPNLITVIEITRRAGMKAIGQVTSYPILYRETYNPPIMVTGLIVAEELISDTLPVLQKQHLNYILLPPVPENG